MIELKINKNESDINIKEYIKNRFNLTSSKVGKMIDSGDVKVNNNKVTFKYILKENDVLKIYSIHFKKVNMDFLKTKYIINIFYEDQNILIINKSRGILCQEDANNKIETLNNAIKKYLYNTKQWGPYNSNDFVPNLCHRLDKYTSGLIIAAKNKEALVEINNLIQNNKLTKIYQCLVLGIPKHKEQTLINYIKQNDDKNIMEIDYDNQYNKKIITKYKVIESYKGYSKLDVEILTGKKHQIRVHLASINHPLLGDTKYNKVNTMGYKYPCLISKEIKFHFDTKSKLSYLNNKEFKLNKIIFD